MLLLTVLWTPIARLVPELKESGYQPDRRDEGDDTKSQPVPVGTAQFSVHHVVYRVEGVDEHESGQHHSEYISAPDRTEHHQPDADLEHAGVVQEVLVIRKVRELSEAARCYPRPYAEDDHHRGTQYNRDDHRPPGDSISIHQAIPPIAARPSWPEKTARAQPNWGSAFSSESRVLIAEVNACMYGIERTNSPATSCGTGPLVTVHTRRHLCAGSCCNDGLLCASVPPAAQNTSGPMS